MASSRGAAFGPDPCNEGGGAALAGPRGSVTTPIATHATGPDNIPAVQAVGVLRFASIPGALLHVHNIRGAVRRSDGVESGTSNPARLLRSWPARSATRPVEDLRASAVPSRPPVASAARHRSRSGALSPSRTESARTPTPGQRDGRGRRSASSSSRGPDRRGTPRRRPAANIRPMRRVADEATPRGRRSIASRRSHQPNGRR